MRPTRLIVALVVALVGLVWIGQGTGALGGSVMSGNAFWAIVGGVLVVAALGLVILERRRARA